MEETDDYLFLKFILNILSPLNIWVKAICLVYILFSNFQTRFVKQSFKLARGAAWGGVTFSEAQGGAIRANIEVKSNIKAAK